MNRHIYLTLLIAGLLTACSDSQDKEATPMAEPPPQIEQIAEPEPEPEPEEVRYDGNAEVGKIYAEEACASCHGMNGMKTRYGTPYIAGQDKDYLFSAQQAYLTSDRHNSAMKAAIEPLNPETIADISAYYASLKGKWQGSSLGVTPETAIRSFGKKEIAAGKALAKRCNSCHGENGNSVSHLNSPSLASMSPEYFSYSLNTYFNGEREHKFMKIFGLNDSLNDKEIEQLAAYYAVQIPQKPPKPKTGNPEKGRKLAAHDCGGCHGIDGNASNPDFPSLSGQPEDYLIAAMKDYQNGRRNDPIMPLALRNYTEAMLADIAAYYAIQQPLSRYPAPPKRAVDYPPMDDGIRIARSCDACHGHNGNSSDPGTPSLTGLTVKYLTQATLAYRDGEWEHGAMKTMSYYLTEEEAEKVSLFYAQQQPKLIKKPKGFDKAAGEKIAPACTLCHNDETIRNNPQIPSLYGQDMAYLINATKAYADGRRNNSEEMSLIAEAIKAQAPENLVNVAGYFASTKAEKPPFTMPKPPIVTIVKQCGGCHGEKGEGIQPGIPRLAGQVEGYLLGIMREYRDGKRRHSEMNEIGNDLTMMEIKDIAAYYASH